MKPYTIAVIDRLEGLPLLDNGNFFHSVQLFRLAKQTPRQRPFMVVATASDGTVASHLLGIVRYRGSWFPPFLYSQCRMLGEGVYATNDANECNELFGNMIAALNKRLGNTVLFTEVSNLSHKMFGYRELRQQHFFPVHWMSIHNSLHSRPPIERISNRMKQHIERAYQRGVTTLEATTEQDFEAFSRLLRRHNILKPKRFIPDDQFFKGIVNQQAGRLYVTKYHEHVIGCAAVAYSGRNAYLWYTAFRRKSFAFVHPDVLTIWHVLDDSHKRGYDHVFFLDVGLPFRKNPFREFILRFGGKPTSTYRWFHSPIRWVNTVLSWFWRE